MVAPLLVVVGITEQLVTMGAEDFRVISTEDDEGIPRTKFVGLAAYSGTTTTQRFAQNCMHMFQGESSLTFSFAPRTVRKTKEHHAPELAGVYTVLHAVPFVSAFSILWQQRGSMDEVDNPEVCSALTIKQTISSRPDPLFLVTIFSVCNLSPIASSETIPIRTSWCHSSLNCRS